MRVSAAPAVSTQEEEEDDDEDIGEPLSAPQAFEPRDVSIRS